MKKNSESIYDLASELEALNPEKIIISTDEIKQDKKNQYDEDVKKGICPNCKTNFIVNTKTGEMVRLGCKRYDCPVCGKYRAFRLSKALKSYFKTFKTIRMMTLTFRTSIFANPHHCAMMSSKIMRYFTTYMRRADYAHKREQGFQYVRIAEFTENGFLHYHILIDRYLRWQTVCTAWNRAINTVMGIKGLFTAHTRDEMKDNPIFQKDMENYNGSVNFQSSKSQKYINIDGTISAKNAANYVVKYVVKAAKDFREKFALLYANEARRFKLYTKSAQICLFPPSESNGEWKFIRMSLESDEFELNIYTLVVTSQITALKIAKNNGIP